MSQKKVECGAVRAIDAMRRCGPVFSSMMALMLAVVLGFAGAGCKRKQADNTAAQFAQAMTRGQGYLERGDATNAVAQYSEAVRLGPQNVDARLNLASSHLLAGNSEQVIQQAEQAVAMDPNSAAAYYLIGCARMRLNQPELALQAFQNSQRIDPAVTALDFQLGLAHDRLGQVDEAIREFETVIQFEPDHPSAHYLLSRLYQRINRATEAQDAMTRHQQALAKNPSPPSGNSAFEKSKYTQPRVAFTLAQPDARGVNVVFADATEAAFGAQSKSISGPIAVLDYNHDGRNSLFVKSAGGFQLLDNRGGRFTSLGDAVGSATNSQYAQALAGDLNNDRFEDVIVLGEQVSHAFRFATNGQAREVTAAAGLKGFRGVQGVLADLDFTGKLDLLVLLPGNEGLRMHRNLGNFYFQDNTAASGLPTNSQNALQLAVEDWKNEDVPGVFIVRKGSAPVFFQKQRAGTFVETNLTVKIPAATAILTGDFNNDLRPDVAVFNETSGEVFMAGATQGVSIGKAPFAVQHLQPADLDNDGWEDILAYGKGICVWRNKGNAGFENVTAKLGIDKLTDVTDVAQADFDNDGDTDLAVATTQGAHYLRNDGGNANKQLKIRLAGNRSNASGLGVRLELTSGNWRSLRTVTRLPVEIGVGKNQMVEVLKTRWFDLATTVVDVPIEAQPLVLEELTLPTGSCPYLYTWTGTNFRFVTDILGASPMGLPVSHSRYVEADPEEYLELGTAESFPTTNGNYEVRITEELREVLYLDYAKLVAVDHPPDTLVLPTSKMLPGRPFLPHALWQLKKCGELRRAVRNDGLDATEHLRRVDRVNTGPVRLREPQLRGLAEPWHLDFEFTDLPEDKPLVLVLNGWLRFGGGMANIAGSIDPSLPFPFPVLEYRDAQGAWTKLDGQVGVPAGKTKTILVDLEGKVPRGVKQFRLTCAFELYWDAIYMAVKSPDTTSARTSLEAASADLRWHGYGKFEPLPNSQPLTPRYDDVDQTPQWSRTPYGWCTRYGDVRELLRSQDHAMVLLNGGDEVALQFKANELPPLPPGFVRDFFLHVVGWDKDADFHVGQGWRLDPLPYVGMDDQAYGKPGFVELPRAEWQQRYNTRWVAPLILRSAAGRPASVLQNTRK